MSARRSLLDRALAAVGLQRAARGGQRVYAGAQINRLTQDWFAAMLSADQTIKGDLRKLRDRSRQLVRDFSYASRFVQSVAENVAGPNGTALQVRVANADGAFKRTMNDTIEEGWAEWAEECTVDGRLSFPDLEHLLCESLPQDGAFLVRTVTGFRGNRFRFGLQVLDPDQLDETITRAPGEGGNEIRQGVEVDGWGRPVAYWIWTQHPGDYARGVRRRERVSADEILHGYVMRRPGQTHGVPWFAPILLDERMLQGFQEAAVVAARIGAARTHFLQAPDPNQIVGEPLPTSYSEEIEAGVGQVLPPGYQLADYNPTYPNNEFDPFRTAILNSIAMGCRVSQLTLTGDLRQANYSSMRAGLLPERDAWRLVHGWFTRRFHRRVYRAWLRAAVLASAVEVAPREMERALRADRWLPRGFPWVDPEKDMRAKLMAIAAGIETLTDVCAENGRELEEQFQKRAREIQLAAEYGVPIDLGITKAQPQQQNGDANGDGQGADGAAGDAAGGGDRARREPLRIARSHLG